MSELRGHLVEVSLAATTFLVDLSVNLASEEGEYDVRIPGALNLFIVDHDGNGCFDCGQSDQFVITPVCL